MRWLAIWGLLMATVFEVLLDTGRLLEELREGAATADGTATTLIDTTLSASEGHADDEWNGGTLFWKTNTDEIAPVQVTSEPLGTLVSATALSGTLDHVPVVPGSVRLYVPYGSGSTAATDDGAGAIGSAAAVTDEAYTPSGGTFTLAHAPVVPGSISTSSPTPISDDGAGVVYRNSDVVGTIDYATGVVTSNLKLEGVISYEYYFIYGTVDYATGAVSLTVDTAQTGTVYAAYQYYPETVFFPVMLNVTDFAVATGTLTLTAASHGVATAEGDTYGLLHRRYPKWLLFQKLTEALREMKAYLLDYTDIPVSSLVDNETALADTVRIHSIWLGYTASTPRDWVMLTRYRHVNGRLQFYDTLRADGDTVRVKYYGDVPAVDDAADTLPASIDPMWLAYETAVKCARWRLFQPGADEKAQTTLVNDLLARRNDQKARANIITPNPSALKTAILPER